MLVQICLQIVDFWKKQSRLKVQVIISSVTLCEKKKRQNFAQLVGAVFAHGETSSWENYSSLSWKEIQLSCLLLLPF